MVLSTPMVITNSASLLLHPRLHRLPTNLHLVGTRAAKPVLMFLTTLMRKSFPQKKKKSSAHYVRFTLPTFGPLTAKLLI